VTAARNITCLCWFTSAHPSNAGNPIFPAFHIHASMAYNMQWLTEVHAYSSNVKRNALKTVNTSLSTPTFQLHSLTDGPS
jgi:hypothetical protein